MRVDFTRGQILHMEWELPINVVPAPITHLGINGDDLSFFNNHKRIAMFTSSISNELAVHYVNDTWILHFATNDTSFLPIGESQYSVSVYGPENEEIFSDNGTVCVHE